MKRTLPFLLILALIALQLPYFLPVKAAAATVDVPKGFINVLDLATPDNSGDYNFHVSPSEPTVTFTLPYTVDWYYVEVLFSFAGTIPTGLVARTVSQDVHMTFLHWDGYLRGYCGFIPGGSDTITFTFQTTGDVYLNVEQFYLSTVTTESYNVSGVFDLMWSGVINQRVNFDTSSAEGNYWAGTPASGDGALKSSVVVDDWQYYDFLTITFYTSYLNIQAIDVLFGGESIPFELSYLSSEWDDQQDLIFSIRLDLRHLDRSILINNPDADLQIMISSTFLLGKTILFSVLEGNYYYISDSIDPLYSWFRIINNSISGMRNSLYSAISSAGSTLSGNITGLRDTLYTVISSVGSTLSGNITGLRDTLYSVIKTQGESIVSKLESLLGSTGAGEEVKNEGASIRDDFSNAQSQLDSVNKPSGGDITAVDSLSGVNFSGNTSYLTQIVNTKYIKDVFVFVSVLAILSLVLFGSKKGG